jgi:hypothetical protein
LSRRAIASAIESSTDDGPREMKYNDPVPCKYNTDKKCDTCGKCLEEDWKS